MTTTDTRGAAARARTSGTSALRPEAAPSGVPRVPRPTLRVLPSRTGGAPRTPFVLLVLTLLGAGLVALLLLNAASVANADTERRLRAETTELELRAQQLRRDVTTMAAPESLAEMARQLGMVPSGEPAFLVRQPDGTFRVAGSPSPAPGRRPR